MALDEFSPGCGEVEGDLVCVDLDLAAGESINFDVSGSVASDAATLLVFIGRVSSMSGDSDPSSDVAVVMTPLEGVTDLVLDAYFLPASPEQGFSATANFEVRNLGPSDSLGSILNVTLPAELSGWAAPAGCIETAALAFSCQVGPVVAGAETTVAFSADVPVGVADGTEIEATGELVASQTDPDETNNADLAWTIIGAEITVVPRPECNPTPGSCLVGTTWGDPHLVSFDGLGFDFQSVGEFVLMESTDGSAVVQVRHEPWGSSRRVSVNTAAAMQVGADRVGFYAGGGVWVNGAAVTVADNTQLDLAGGGVVVRVGDHYYVGWPVLGSGDRMVVDVRLRSSALNLSVEVPPEWAGHLTGLLGDGDGDTDNDLFTRAGTVLARPVSPGVLYGGFADSWRITAAESLFDYGAGESTATFTDVSFPDSVVTVSDLVAEDAEAARLVCVAAGVTDPVLLDACILDVALTGDAAFAEGAASAPVPTAVIDGTYFESFDDTVGTEWSPATTSVTDLGDRRFLGRFGSDTVQLDLSELPAHTGGTLVFDLFVLGDWDGDDATNGPDRFQVKAEGQVVVDTTFSNTAADQSYPDAFGEGTNPARTAAAENDSIGVTSSVYRVAVPFSHWDDTIGFDLVGSGLSSLTGEEWGVDNVEVHLDRLLPERFDYQLGQVVSYGLPRSGAGVIEQERGEDVYEFTVAEASTVTFDLTLCPGLWLRLVDSSGEVIFDEQCPQETTDLAAGAYELWVSSPGYQTGSYSFRALVIPDPESFPIVVGDTVTDGVPALGAGRLETAGAKDHYPFTLAAATDVAVGLEACPYGFEWLITDATGVAVAGGGCWDHVIVPDLAAGDYTISVFSPDYDTGAYTLGLSAVPTPESFDVALGDVVSPGVPAAGAGVLEAPGAVDIYQFDVAVAAEVAMWWQYDPSLEDWVSSPHWTLTRPDGSTSTGSSTTVVALTPGAHTLAVYSNYALTGSYKLSLLTRSDPELFPLGPGGAVYEGFPTAGAGSLETPGAEDHYTFTVAEAGTWVFEYPGSQPWHNCQLLDGTGAVFYSACPGVIDLDAGDYTLRVYDQHDAVMDYSFYLWGAAVTETKPLQPGIVSSDALTGLNDRHRWELTLGAATDVRVDWETCPPGGKLTLFNGAGSTLRSLSCGQTINLDLTAGDYAVEVSTSDTPGPYAFLMQAFEAAQTFSLNLGDTVTDGVPAVGAGHLETPLAQDRYTFTVEAGQTVAYELICTPYGVTADLYQDGSNMETVGCNDVESRYLNPGDYHIEVTTTDDTARTYQLTLWGAQTPETFAIALGDPIADGIPGPGAGNLENPTASDVYVFTVTETVDVVIDGGCSVEWRLERNGGYVADDDCGTSEVHLIPGGYELSVTPRDTSYSGPTYGPYTLTMVAVPPPDEFAIAVDTVVSDGQPATGAGNLEAAHATDTYTFTVDTPGEMVVALNDCITGLEWTLYDPTLQWVESGWCYPAGTGESGIYDLYVALPMGGEYRLDVTTRYPDHPGTYQLSLLSDTVQRFDLTLGDLIAAGIPGAGAGTLETRGSQDHYAFTLDQPTALLLDTPTCVAGTEIALWRHYPGDGWYEDWASWECDPTWDESHLILETGEYQLRVLSHDGATGDYSLRLGPPLTDTFTVADEFTASPGLPAAGAGTLETETSVDQYKFTVPAEAGYIVTATDCTSDVYMRLRPVEENWWYQWWGCDTPRTANLDPGDYHLDIYVDYDTPPGDYHLEIRLQPQPQTFEVAIGDTITDGVPGAGAGNLEDIGSEDNYTFTVATPGFVHIAGDNCPADTDGRLTGPAYSEWIPPCNGRTVYLHPGPHTYTVTSDSTGTYTLGLEPG